MIHTTVCASVCLWLRVIFLMVIKLIGMKTEKMEQQQQQQQQRRTVFVLCHITQIVGVCAFFAYNNNNSDIQAQQEEWSWRGGSDEGKKK